MRQDNKGRIATAETAVDISPWPQRFWEKVNVSALGCWTWTGALTDGYGVVNEPGRGARRAHRVILELLGVPLTEGMHIDHLCRNRACVRPDHLEEVTLAENNRRMVRDVYASQDACKRGHPWAEFGRNHTAGFRYCVECHRLGEAERQRRSRV